MLKKLFIIVTFFILYSCSKSSNSTTPENINTDTLFTDVIKVEVSEYPQFYTRLSFSCCLNVIWGDGLINNYPTLNQTDGYRDSTGSINHRYTGNLSNNHRYFLKFSGKGITYFATGGISSGGIDTVYMVPVLDVSGCPSLNTLYCSYSKTQYINVRNCLKLTHLTCPVNKLDTINLLTNKQLTYLDCNNNNIFELNLKENQLLYDINCSYNRLTELSLINHKFLNSLNCSNNNLTELKILSTSNVNQIDCSNNKLTSATLNNIFDSLPVNKYNSNSLKIYIKNNPGTLSCDPLIANRKGWSVYTN